MGKMDHHFVRYKEHHRQAAWQAVYECIAIARLHVSNEAAGMCPYMPLCLRVAGAKAPFSGSSIRLVCSSKASSWPDHKAATCCLAQLSLQHARDAPASASGGAALGGRHGLQAGGARPRRFAGFPLARSQTIMNSSFAVELPSEVLQHIFSVGLPDSDRWEPLLSASDRVRPTDCCSAARHAAHGLPVAPCRRRLQGRPGSACRPGCRMQPTRPQLIT